MLNTLRNKLFIFVQYILPKRILSKLISYLAYTEITYIKNLLINLAIKLFKIDISEVSNYDIRNYPNFNAFFTRKIDLSLRPQSRGLSSPADGSISQLGNIVNGQILQAKGKYYPVNELTNYSTHSTVHFKSFINIYLSPKDYHCVHMPIDGTLVDLYYLPGTLYSVNNTTAQYIPKLFSKNERLVFIFETTQGKMGYVMVGAMLVCGIQINNTTINLKNVNSTLQRYKHKLFKQGELLAQFSFGSTVILLSEQELNWDNSLHTQTTIKVGQQLAELS